MVEKELLGIQFNAFNNKWFLLQNFLKKIGNPNYTIIDGLSLYGNKDIRNFDTLIKVFSNLILDCTAIDSLGTIEYVGGFLSLNSSNISSFGNLKYVGGYLSLNKTSIKSLENIEYIGGNLYLEESKLSSVGNLKYIGGNVVLMGNKLTINDFKNVTIRGNFQIISSK